jgi:very-short-patch-repair endonuclease
MQKQELQELINKNYTLEKIGNHYKLSISGIRRWLKKYHLKTKIASKEIKKVLSQSEKDHLSVKRKEFLMKNPDKHNWKNSSKKKSEPCEFLKNLLQENNIPFIEEYQPLLNQQRFYSIDISWPHLKIGIEINGRQHYNADGTLAKYYQERHDLIEKEGWKLHEIYYMKVFNQIKIMYFIQNILNENKDILNIEEMNKVQQFRESNKVKHTQYTYGPIWHKNMARISSRKVVRPSKEELEKMLWEEPTSTIAKKYGLSDNAITKWAKAYNLNKPPRGYWTKKLYNKL